MYMSDNTLRTWDVVFFFQAEDGIRDLVRSRGLGDVYKRQQEATLKAYEADLQKVVHTREVELQKAFDARELELQKAFDAREAELQRACLLYTSDAADERSSVDLGGRRIINKKTNKKQHRRTHLI